MEKALIFCNPADVYKELSASEAAEAYTKFAIEDYDKLVTFGPSYDPTISDLEMIIGNKESKELKLTVFANQPIKSVGNVHFAHGAGAKSTSYLFNPVCALKDKLLLPDLDVIDCNREIIVNEIRKFYEAAGWKTKVYEEEPKTAIVTTPRFPKGLIIADPSALITLAEKEVGYDRKKLCFKTE